MTIEERMRQLLSEHGAWSEIDEVIATTKTVLKREMPSVRWSDTFAGYPPQFEAAVWWEVRRQAVAWIDKNCPGAFYRELLVDEGDQPQAQPAPGSTFDCTVVPVAEFGYVIDAPEDD